MLGGKNHNLFSFSFLRILFFLFCFGQKQLFNFEPLQENNFFTNYSTFLLHGQIHEITIVC